MPKNFKFLIKNFAHATGQIVLTTVRHIQQEQLLMVASSLAYITLLSIIPLLALSFAVFQAFGGMQKLYNMIEPFILSNLAQGAGDEVINKMHVFIDNTHAGVVGAGGFIGLIFTCMSLLSSIEKAINHVWRVKLTRSYFQRFSYYWLLITLGPLALSIAFGVATSNNFPIAKLFPTGTGIYLITVLCFFLIYKWVPQTVVKWQQALIASVATASLWNLARIGYAYYTEHIVTYNKVYGSLGAIPILMLWIYIEWVIVLLGAALNATLQKKI